MVIVKLLLWATDETAIPDNGDRGSRVMLKNLANFLVSLILCKFPCVLPGTDPYFVYFEIQPLGTIISKILLEQLCSDSCHSLD